MQLEKESIIILAIMRQKKKLRLAIESYNSPQVSIEYQNLIKVAGKPYADKALGKIAYQEYLKQVKRGKY